MTMFSPLRFKVIATACFTLVTIMSFAQCKEINVEAKVVKGTNEIGASQSILVDIKESNSNSFQLSLFGPQRNNILNTDKTEFNNLVSGKYLVVIIGRREKDNYCPKSINVTIN